ncbi:MAG: hypothetical protein ICV77_00650 [Cyanobacteria bacterium Co-bin8]|nr:hypothetical protein [Cyanobacteria bacterium Co-bin8]
MDKAPKYRFVCTLTFGDIYGQVIVWLVILLISLAASLALMGARQPVFALATVGLILVLSLPFLLFAFVTTLVNHIEFKADEPQVETARPASGTISSQQAAQAVS